MTDRTHDQDHAAMLSAIQDALDHALAYGDDRTAYDLAAILRSMPQDCVSMAA